MASYLARFKGISRTHAESDLRAYLGWCADCRLDPLAASRPHVELYVRWMQEVRRLKPSTVSRRMSIVAGYYRTAVIDGLLEHSPAEHVRRPHVPADSPTLGRMPPIHPHMLRHTYVTTMLDAGVDLRDVQIAARHADPRTTRRYDRARNHLDRHPNSILAADMPSGTEPPVRPTNRPTTARFVRLWHPSVVNGGNVLECGLGSGRGSG